MKTNQLECVSQHIPALQEFAMKFTKDLDSAKDLVQDTMLKALRYYEKFEEGTNMRGWLFTIMRNNFINSFRRSKMSMELISQTEELSYDQLLSSSTANGCENRFIKSDIRKALDTMPEYLYHPFIRYVEGYKYHEIARDSNAPIGTIKTRIFEARRLLKKNLQDYKSFATKD